MKTKIQSLLTLGFIIQALILPACAQTGVVLNTLKSFNFFTNGASPYAGLVQGNDGNFYGTTEHGGIHGGFGTVFKISINGELTRLYSFTGANDGAFPDAALVQGSDGYLYGTTANGGTNDIGTVFKISTNGVLISLYSFTGGYDGKNPNELVRGSDGNLYGTTESSGTNNYGTVFKITTNGVLTSLYSFGAIQDEYGDPLDGAFPRAALVQGSDGYLYGTTTSSGTNGSGTVFKITTNGVLTSLYSFTGGDDGASPFAALVQGSDGYLYGTTASGGTNNSGTVFKISTNGALTSLYSFTGGDDGANPFAALVQGSDGYFYGTTLFVAGTNSGYGTVFKISTNGALTSLYSFTGGDDGANPYAALVQGSDGYLYGTTYQGGTNGNGTVFKINTNGVLISLYSFTGGDDGANPFAALVQGSDGYLYGTTYAGGTHGGSGTVFKITTNGVLTSLYSFTGGDDGANPQAALVQGSDGYLYGTTASGGTNNSGTVFKISTNGALTSLYSFTGGNDGANPYAALVQGSDGYFYGTTASGGTNNSGTVFKISTNGALTSLYSFTGGNDGGLLFAALVQGNDGYFYGTTVSGGTNGGSGTVFKISTNGVLTSLYSFTGGNDGALLFAALVQGNDGYLYGTTYQGGTNGNGTVFKISTNGVLTSLYSFTGINDGENPSKLVQGRDGYFYGTTVSGGTNGGSGTVFKISTHGVLTRLYIFTGGDDGASPYAGLVQGSDGNFYGTTYSGGAGKSGTVFQLTILPIVQPQLNITHFGAYVVLTWPASTTGFNLESATNLVSPIVWNINSQAPIVINGQNVVTNPLSGKQVFFRLRH